MELFPDGVELFLGCVELDPNCAKLVGVKLIDVKLNLSRRLEVGHRENLKSLSSNKEKSAT